MFFVHLTIYNFMVRALSTQEACIQNIDQTISHSYEEKKLTSASRLSKKKNNYSACWNSEVQIYTKTLTYNTFFRCFTNIGSAISVTRMLHHFWLFSNKKTDIFFSRKICRISDGLKFKLTIFFESLALGIDVMCWPVSCVRMTREKPKARGLSLIGGIGGHRYCVNKGYFVADRLATKFVSVKKSVSSLPLKRNYKDCL
jgi:hypothetical protein